jgi:transcriptional regulator with XRE-family HTH domain
VKGQVKNLVLEVSFLSILSARVRAGFSQAKLAQEVGVSDAAVCQWETGKNHPRSVLLPKIAKALNCSVEELLPDNDANAEFTRDVKDDVLHKKRSV